MDSTLLMYRSVETFGISLIWMVQISLKKIFLLLHSLQAFHVSMLIP